MKKLKVLKIRIDMCKLENSFDEILRSTTSTIDTAQVKFSPVKDYEN